MLGLRTSMWSFTALNLHQSTDSKAQVSENNGNNHKSNDIARSYQRRHSSGREAIAERFLQRCRLLAFS